jgi:hypothetical protein
MSTFFPIRTPVATPAAGTADAPARGWPARLGAAAFIAAPAAMLSFFTLTGRYLPRDDARLYLEQVAGLGNRFPAATFAYLVAAALNLGVGLATVRLLGKRPSGYIAG